MSRPLRLSLLLGLALGLPGCGQKGQLYLPERGGEVITRPTQTPATPEPTEPGKPGEKDKPATPPQPPTP